MGARSKHDGDTEFHSHGNSRVPRWGHDQNYRSGSYGPTISIAECPDGGTIKTLCGVDACLKTE